MTMIIITIATVMVTITVFMPVDDDAYDDEDDGDDGGW